MEMMGLTWPGMRGRSGARVSPEDAACELFPGQPASRACGYLRLKTQTGESRVCRQCSQLSSLGLAPPHSPGPPAPPPTSEPRGWFCSLPLSGAPGSFYFVEMPAPISSRLIPLPAGDSRPSQTWSARPFSLDSSSGEGRETTGLGRNRGLEGETGSPLSALSLTDR